MIVKRQRERCICDLLITSVEDGSERMFGLVIELELARISRSPTTHATHSEHVPYWISDAAIRQKAQFNSKIQQLSYMEPYAYDSAAVGARGMSIPFECAYANSPWMFLLQINYYYVMFSYSYAIYEVALNAIHINLHMSISFIPKRTIQQP